MKRRSGGAPVYWKAFHRILVLSKNPTHTFSSTRSPHDFPLFSFSHDRLSAFSSWIEGDVAVMLCCYAMPCLDFRRGERNTGDELKGRAVREARKQEKREKSNRRQALHGL